MNIHKVQKVLQVFNLNFPIPCFSQEQTFFHVDIEINTFLQHYM